MSYHDQLLSLLPNFTYFKFVEDRSTYLLMSMTLGSTIGVWWHCQGERLKKNLNSMFWIYPSLYLLRCGICGMCVLVVHRVVHNPSESLKSMLSSLRPLHSRDWEPVTITPQALSLVEKAEPVQVRYFTLCSRDQHSIYVNAKWM